jgi:hypothetical protein
VEPSGTPAENAVFVSKHFLCLSRACLGNGDRIRIYIETAQKRNVFAYQSRHRSQCCTSAGRAGSSSCDLWAGLWPRSPTALSHSADSDACQHTSTLTARRSHRVRTCSVQYWVVKKRLKLRLSRSARKSQKRFRDTPRFKFPAVLARIQPCLSQHRETGRPILIQILRLIHQYCPEQVQISAGDAGRRKVRHANSSSAR